eukprot:CAMPEP_0204588902 /NCGR_PEP_ID=MMETSP0661-20131031/48889_1 /ASSEMBLY_ACC=CAM_ASM_000606 /TAXON_ID=109239 /ORGANISM="Alexandrium margalefi, Strain AMGDE01CS-322" /LENGTH=43 /DNA_ID= /DNA_START= /DNA_END= /DNA_ORIENTATION=
MPDGMRMHAPPQSAPPAGDTWVGGCSPSLVTATENAASALHLG